MCVVQSSYYEAPHSLTQVWAMVGSNIVDSPSIHDKSINPELNQH